jgi:hypothetical protein
LPVSLDTDEVVKMFLISSSEAPAAFLQVVGNETRGLCRMTYMFFFSKKKERKRHR